jgi:hypothetical protein
MNVLERIGVFGRRIRGWLPRDPIAAAAHAALGQRVSNALQSLGVSIGVCAVILLSAYAAFQFGPLHISEQIMSPFGPGWTLVQYGCAFAAAILYASFSIKSFNGRVLSTILRVARNVVIAVPAGFLFTIALYSNPPTSGELGSCCLGTSSGPTSLFSSGLETVRSGRV